jgi:hypothetical protein
MVGLALECGMADDTLYRVAIPRKEVWRQLSLDLGQ